MKHGDQVICMAPSIDDRAGHGSTGVITGFSRFSVYHPREAMVRLDSGSSHWFWERDLQLVRGHVTAATRAHEGHEADMYGFMDVDQAVFRAAQPMSWARFVARRIDHHAVVCGDLTRAVY